LALLFQKKLLTLFCSIKNKYRYKGNSAWRQDNQTSPSTMRAREWKNKTSQISNLKLESRMRNGKQATTPEAQLLQYGASDRLPFRKLSISRNDPNMSLIPVEGQASICMTLGDGSRVFVRQLEEKDPPTSSIRSSPSGTNFSLGISMTDLLSRVQAMRRKKEHDNVKALSKELRQQRQRLTSTTDGEDEEDDAMELEEETPEQPEPQRIQDDQLWVDKHAPSSFANLLSDERTNREVLRVLREWDPYVFKKDPPPRPKFGAQEEEEEETPKNPNDKRPKEKSRVILLSGSPGVGKTTLAHILAQHCGYRPLEVNGSDERSGGALSDRVVRAMETATIDMSKRQKAGDASDWKGRPNCIIIDEIDGADAKQALKSMVELIRQEMPNPKANEGGKKRANKPYLKRPIIFICNNLYAPALRPLLPFARVFQVEPPAAPRLVARLRAVLSAEGLSLWGGTRLLHDLVSASGGDIRSCLYTLQFAAAQIHQQEQRSKVHDISKTLQSSLNGDGMKDHRNDVANTTMTVFRKVKNKGKKDRLWGTRQMMDRRTSVERVFDAVEASAVDLLWSSSCHGI
jgi:DNA polymerase III delta prime subunit